MGRILSSFHQNGSASGSQLKKTVYKFLIPETLCGLFIGKSGRNISALKQETNTNIKIGREPVLSTFRYCTVEGRLLFIILNPSSLFETIFCLHIQIRA